MKNIPKIARVVVFIFMAMWFMPQKNIEGSVRLVGTALFPSLILETDSGEVYYIDDALFDEFVRYQHLTVKIRAKVKNVEFEGINGDNTIIHPTIIEAKIRQ